MVMRAVLDRGEIPTRSLFPEEINEELWELWTRCWKRDVSSRPTAVEILERMLGFTTSSTWAYTNATELWAEANTFLWPMFLGWLCQLFLFLLSSQTLSNTLNSWICCSKVFGGIPWIHHVRLKLGFYWTDLPEVMYTSNVLVNIWTLVICNWVFGLLQNVTDLMKFKVAKRYLSVEVLLKVSRK
jgi:hypothetical protein